MGRLSLFFGFAAALIAGQVALRAQTPADWVTQQQADSALKNVVRIETSGSSGAGFIIGRRGSQLWVATAAHVVFSQSTDADGFPVPMERITMRMRDGREWTAGGVPLRGFGEDLAFLPFQVPSAQEGAPAWRELVIEHDPEPGARARIAATSTAIQFADWDGEVALSGEDMSVTGLDSAGEGQSGAPVFAGRGFVGMYLRSAGQRVLPIRTIEAAAREANLPWTLVAYPARPVAVRVCVEATGTPMAALRINSVGGGIARADADGCFATSSGPASIFVDGQLSSYRCTPATATLSSESEQRLAIVCEIDLGGISWTSNVYGTVTFTPAGDRRWNFSGLDRAPFGPVTGSAALIANQVFVHARNGMNQPVEGALNVEPGRLSGALMVEGQRYDVELTR